jgi:hypothetical protein
MKKLLFGTLVLTASTFAFAHGCPAEMRAIDAKLPSVKLSDADAAKVKELRAEGEKLHKEGKHTESMNALGQAKKMIGL